MPCSPEQLASNRRNASLSTGPKTESGKNNSRRNALKHGLTGEGVAVLHEDADQVQERFEAFEKDLKPINVMAVYLTQRAAMLSIRIERSCRQEASTLTQNMHLAESTEAELRELENDDLFLMLKDQPATAVRRLRRTPEGIDRLITAWEDLRSTLVAEGPIGWKAPQSEQAENLTGRAFPGLHRSKMMILADQLPRDGTNRSQLASQEMAAIIDGQIAQLRRDREALDHEAIQASRANAADRALFDTSKQATLARKYEAAADREFYKALQQIERINAQPVDPKPIDVSPAETEVSEELGSFGIEPVGDSPTPERPTEPAETPAIWAANRPNRDRKLAEPTPRRSNPG